LKKCLACCILVFVFCSCNVQNGILSGTEVELDGKNGYQEWHDAMVYDFRKNNVVRAEILLKRNATELLIAFSLDHKQDSIYIFPEVFIDTRHDQSEKWNSDDYWFHVSASDCYAVGMREEYSNCLVDGRDWKALPNYPMGDQYKKIEFFELAIPFKLLGIKVGQSIGICFSLASFPGNGRVNYPNAAHEDIPASWLTMIIE